MAEVITEREQEILELVTRAMGQHFVTVKPVNVHTIDGGEAVTLRFTADDASSSDLNRERIASGEESTEQLAREVSADLQLQLGTPVS